MYSATVFALFPKTARLTRLWRSPHSLALSALVLALAIIWARPGPPLLRGSDAAVYAEVAAECAARPLSQWANPTLAGEPFFEHPPGFMFLEATFFRAFGATAKATVALAHTMATALVLFTAAIAYRVAGVQAAAGAILGLCCLSGFYAESQNAMLELPVNVALLWGLWGLLAFRAPHTPSLGAWVAAVLGPVCAFWAKGPVAGLWVPIALTTVISTPIAWRRAAQVFILTGVITVVSVLAAEGLRYRMGLEAFVPHYVRHQLWPSIHVGRHHPVASPFYYLPILARWYLPGCMALALGIYAGVRSQNTGARLLSALATVWVMTVVIGFSCMRQKYQWYMHSAMPAFALGTAAFFAAWPIGIRTLAPYLTWGAIVAAGMVLGSGALLPPSSLRAPPVLLALQSIESQPFVQSDPLRRLAICLPHWGWRERYVALFVHHAVLVDCAASADAQLMAHGWQTPGVSPGRSP
jgi:4-amino-4-deoxy-L-arabinose transferase-like glycosyltransferase